MFFDSHAHYDHDQFDSDRELVLDRLKEEGISNVINAASDIDSSKKAIKLTEKYSYFYCSVGIHPHDVSKANEEDIAKLKKLSENNKVVAVGEIGLDYYYNHSAKETQRQWFKKQLNLARELNLPVIIHDRDAHADCLDIIMSEKIEEIGGVFHCYSGSWEMAKKLLDMGLYISFSGSITFKNAVKLIEVVKNIPKDRMLIETDCPYLAPVPYRGKRNDSSYIKYTAEKIADVKGISIEEVAHLTADNTKTLFRIL